MTAYIKKTITTTALARNLAATIDHVRLSGRVIDIIKGNQTVAQLTPATQAGLPIAQLSDFLQSLPHIEHNKSMSDDLKAIRNHAMLPDDQTLWD